MSGTSTKLTAAVISAWTWAILSWVLFSAPFGPGWTAPPTEVVAAFTGLLSFVIGWFVKESAVISE